MAIRKGDRIKKLREALILRRQQLVGDLERITTDTRQGKYTTRAGDVVDRAHSDAWLEESSMLAETEERELAAIEEALQMMEEGDYGLCQNCGRSIPVARLTALPTAVYCVKCRAEFDRSGLAKSEHRYALAPLFEDEDSGGRDETRASKEASDLVSDDVTALTDN